MTSHTPGAAGAATTNGRRVLGLEAVNRPRQTAEIEVAGYDGVFRLQEITWEERDQAIAASAADESSDVKAKAQSRKNQGLFMPRIVAFGWIDEQGKRIVENPVVGGGEMVAKLGIGAVQSMYDKIGIMSAMGVEGKKALGKDSSTTPSESGGPVSASSD